MPFLNANIFFTFFACYVAQNYDQDFYNSSYDSLSDYEVNISMSAYIDEPAIAEKPEELRTTIIIPTTETTTFWETTIGTTTTSLTIPTLLAITPTTTKSPTSNLLSELVANIGRIYEEYQREHQVQVSHQEVYYIYKNRIYKKI